MNLRLSPAQYKLLHPPRWYGMEVELVTDAFLLKIVDRWKFEETREAFGKFHNPVNATHRALQKNLQAVR